MLCDGEHPAVTVHTHFFDGAGASSCGNVKRLATVKISILLQ